jgi:hypothetical protein
MLYAVRSVTLTFMNHDWRRPTSTPGTARGTARHGSGAPGKRTLVQSIEEQRQRSPGKRTSVQAALQHRLTSSESRSKKESEAGFLQDSWLAQIEFADDAGPMREDFAAGEDYTADLEGVNDQTTLGAQEVGEITPQKQWGTTNMADASVVDGAGDGVARDDNAYAFDSEGDTENNDGYDALGEGMVDVADNGGAAAVGDADALNAQIDARASTQPSAAQALATNHVEMSRNGLLAAPSVVQHRPRWNPAPIDRYNRRAARGTKVKRPSVRIGGKEKLRIRAKANRYRILSDQRLELVNPPLEKGREIRINPAAPRTIRGHTYILVWADSDGSAWIRVDKIAKKRTRFKKQLLKQVRRKAARLMPDKAPGGFVRRKFLGVVIAPESIPGHILPSQQDPHKNRFDHYLGVEKGYFNICGNLPQRNAPPVAIDIAMPGDAFFLAKGNGMPRKVPIFQFQSHALWGAPETWVFGCLAREVNGTKMPDPRRRGWVPLKALEP